jgi:ribulose-phosphate 3-epimerase
VQSFVSLWSADQMAIGAAVDLVDDFADGYHIDVFDGHNVPELLYGPDFVAALRRRTRKPIDVHLNVTDPEFWSLRFIDSGADMVTVQTEASRDIRSTLETIRSQGAKPSLGLEVHEPPAHAARLFDVSDRVLLMGTAIGVKGVDLDPATPHRLRELGRLRAEAGRSIDELPLFVDGGIRAHTVELLADSGADGVIPGSLVFGVDDPRAAIEHLHGLGCAAG